MKGQACGKVILLGEHAVVYGVPAIAVGIDRGATATAELLEQGPSTLLVRGWEIHVKEGEDTDLSRAFTSLLAVRPTRPVAVQAEADLPPGGGLGCSAAIGVAVARAVDTFATEEQILERAMAWERVFHGNPSGVDAAVAASGGCVYFKKGDPLLPVRVKGGLLFCVGNTGMASSTKSMVESVARQKARRPEIVAKAFEGIQSLVNNARLAIEAGDRFALGRLMDLNQMILSGLFVSSQEIERMCDLARSAGALGAKLTGAGGGGSVVALVKDVSTAERVLESWRLDGFNGFAARVASFEGRRLEISDAAP